MSGNVTLELIARELDELQTEPERIFRWRLAVLREAGYGERLAFKLALRPDVDLHRATDLLRRGCPEETARRILV